MNLVDGFVLLHINPCRLFNAKSCIHIDEIYDLLMSSLSVTFLNKPELIYLLRVKWFQVLLFYTNLFNLIHLFTRNEMVSSLENDWMVQWDPNKYYHSG